MAARVIQSYNYMWIRIESRILLRDAIRIALQVIRMTRQDSGNTDSGSGPSPTEIDLSAVTKSVLVRLRLEAMGGASMNKDLASEA